MEESIYLITWVFTWLLATRLEKLVTSSSILSCGKINPMSFKYVGDTLKKNSLVVINTIKVSNY